MTLVFYINYIKEVKINLKKVVVLFGTASTEHIVSCHSAESVLREINYKKYDVHSIYIDEKNEWYRFNQDFESIFHHSWVDKHQDDKIENICHELQQYDVVFPMLHGAYGENGCIQGLCALLNVPCVGCNLQSSALCFDKVCTKELLKEHNIPVVPYITISKHKYSIKELENKIGYPMIIKPARGGSSIGIEVANNRKECIKAINHAFQFDHKLLVEKFIHAHELECAVLETKDIHVSSVGEIFSANSFYDYDAKYENNQSYTQINADISTDVKEEIRKIAKEAFQLLECSELARIDFFYQEDEHQIYLNEINTLPGFTKISMYPQLCIADGISYSKLISILIENAYKKNRKRK